MEHKGYIYFMANVANSVLYIGVTNSLKRRIGEHAEGTGSVFTHKYNPSLSTSKPFPISSRLFRAKNNSSTSSVLGRTTWSTRSIQPGETLPPIPSSIPPSFNVTTGLTGGLRCPVRAEHDVLLVIADLIGNLSFLPVW